MKRPLSPSGPLCVEKKPWRLREAVISRVIFQFQFRSSSASFLLALVPRASEKLWSRKLSSQHPAGGRGLLEDQQEQSLCGDSGKLQPSALELGPSGIFSWPVGYLKAA